MIDVVMPQMGESIVEGTFTKWLKKPGEHVERDEPLFEISTDKVDTEIPSPAAGCCRTCWWKKARLSPSTRWSRESPMKAARPQRQRPSADRRSRRPAPAACPLRSRCCSPAAPQPRRSTCSRRRRPKPTDEQLGPLSPVVRKIAREHNIDLRQMRGTGAGGRITKARCRRLHVQARRRGPLRRPPAPAPAQLPLLPRPPVQAPPAPAPMPRGEQAKTRIEPMSNMRQKIAEHMIFSQRTSAHVTTVHKVDMTKSRRSATTEGRVPGAVWISLTYLPFVARAAAEAFRAFPIVNASIEGTNIVYHNEINLGIAVALDGGSGLIVPVIRKADEKNVVGLQRSIVDLAARARSRQLKPDEVAGGTFSITNFGSFGSVFATPVINQPQVGDSGSRRCREGARRDRRCDRDSLRRISGLDLRSPAGGWSACRPVCAEDQGSLGELDGFDSLILSYLRKSGLDLRIEAFRPSIVTQDRLPQSRIDVLRSDDRLVCRAVWRKLRQQACIRRIARSARIQIAFRNSSRPCFGQRRGAACSFRSSC